MRYYAAIFLQSQVGEWHVLFPDLPGCEAQGYTLEDAGYAAVTALGRCAERNGAELASPRDLAEIAADTEWLSRHGVQLAKAVVSMVPLAGA